MTLPTNPQPGLKLSDEVVERGATVISQDRVDIQVVNRAHGTKFIYSDEHDLAERVLTAALRLDDPETLARESWDAQAEQHDRENPGDRCDRWEDSEDEDKASWLADVVAVLAALGLGAEPEEADGGG